MLTHNDLKKGVQFVLDGEPYEVLESQSVKMAQRRPIIQSKIKSLISGKVQDRNFQQGDVFQEAELEKIEFKFLYSNRGKLGFCEAANPKNRFELTEEQISGGKFLKPAQIVTGVRFQDKIINIVLPIKVQLKVTEAPPGTKGDRAQSGTKMETWE